MARPKKKAFKTKIPARQEVEPLTIEQWSDIEVRQCSPQPCAICDFHGDLAICDGPCHRQFHHVSRHGETVGGCPAVVIAPDKGGEPWLCPECWAKTYRCFQCGVVSTSTRQCPQPYCVRFYCYACLPGSTESCPIHQCVVCELGHEDPHLAEAVQCLRCPKTWHRACLAEIQRLQEGPTRVPWHHTAHNQGRWMIYCPDHPIDPALGTAPRDHISWL